MESTLGKRIMTHRKRLGLTQDKLAEMMGVTAQAVSKWENNQSCPDITVLPQLADIFGITTDALLGREVLPEYSPEPAAEEPEADAPAGHGFEFYYDEGKREALALAAFVLLVGALTFVSKLLAWDVSFWSILWPCAILMVGVGGFLRKFSFFSMGCVLLGGYFLLDNLNIIQWDMSGELVFPVLILVFGVALLVDALKKPRNSRWSFRHAGKDGKSKNQFTSGDEQFTCALSFGESNRRVVMPRLSRGDISCSFGELVVDLTGCEEFADECRLSAHCSFGELELLVPKHIRIEEHSHGAFAEIDVHGTPDPVPKGIIQLDGKVSFGQIVVRYI